LKILISVGLLKSTAVLCMGEFGRTPRINGQLGADHFAKLGAWCLGGAARRGGRAIGKTSSDGTAVETGGVFVGGPDGDRLPSAGISLQTVFTTPSGRDENCQRRAGNWRAVRVELVQVRRFVDVVRDGRRRIRFCLLFGSLLCLTVRTFVPVTSAPERLEAA